MNCHLCFLPMPHYLLMQKTPGLASIGIQSVSYFNKSLLVSKPLVLPWYKTTFTVFQDAFDECRSLELEWSLVYFPWNRCLHCMIKCLLFLFLYLWPWRGFSPIKAAASTAKLVSVHPGKRTKATVSITWLQLDLTRCDEVMYSHYTRVQHTAVFSSLWDSTGKYDDMNNESISLLWLAAPPRRPSSWFQSVNLSALIEAIYL